MKILFVFTGGTISTTLKDSVLKVDESKPYALIRAYEDRFGIDFEYDYISPYLELSENNTGKHLDELCACVKNNTQKDYDGIIVTHGTDTLQYSASALGYVLGNNCIPVCLVSAAFPLDDSKSNALDNLHGAVMMIKNKLGKGVFVPYKNACEDEIVIHRGTRLLPSLPFSSELKSVKNQEYGRFVRGKKSDYNFLKNGITEREDIALPFTPRFSLASSVLLLNAHPGMIYPELSQKVKYVLISSYHSGTIDTKSTEARAFYLRAWERGIKVYVSGVKNGDIYESATEFSNLNIITLNLSPISAYIKIWLMANSNTHQDSVLQPLGGDTVTNY